MLSSQALIRQGSTDIIDSMISVVPSLNASREPISDAATLVRPVNLRSLPSDHTLVLVNGKRRHRGAQGVDVNPLFGTSLKQVEILRDGASAHYGSDAIAGVINYTLSDDPNACRCPRELIFLRYLNLIGIEALRRLFLRIYD